MPTETRQLSLNLFIYTSGHHEASWRFREVDARAVLDVGFYQDLGQQAEAAKFDAVFFADAPVLQDNIRYSARYFAEPITLLTAIGAVTERIGLIGTASTSYYEPYNLARLYASLDHLSRGRAGWNIVTTSAAQASRNYGLDEPPLYADRYARAGEFVDVVSKLFDSWEDDALVLDPESGIFADDALIHDLNHVGRFFRVKGALNVPRSPQGRPVYIQAGASDEGRSFAARHAEAIFTAHQTLASAQSFYRDIKARAAALGRLPQHVKILPGISPFIGSTEAEAQALYEEFNALVQPAFSLVQLRNMIGLDLSGHDLDAPFPRDLIDDSGERARASRFRLVLDIVDREKPTIRQLINRLAGARGHWVTVGTPEQVADHVQRWFENGAADGFNIMPPWLPGGFGLFVSEVLPILRRRGLFRHEYSGHTLRDHYGLPRTPSQFSGAERASA